MMIHSQSNTNILKMIKNSVAENKINDCVIGSLKRGHGGVQWQSLKWHVGDVQVDLYRETNH